MLFQLESGVCQQVVSTTSKKLVDKDDWRRECCVLFWFWIWFIPFFFYFFFL